MFSSAFHKNVVHYEKREKKIIFNSIDWLVYGFAKRQFYGFGRRRRSNRNSRQNNKFGLLQHTPENVDDKVVSFSSISNYFCYKFFSRQWGRQPGHGRYAETKNHFREKPFSCFVFRVSTFDALKS